MTLLLAGDIGGTKTLLQLFKPTATGIQPVSERQHYISADYEDLVPIVKEFLATAGHQEDGSRPDYACFAIAGPVHNNTCTLTNLSWKLDGDRLGQDLQLDQVALINDFAGIGYGVLGLQPDELHVLQAGTVDPSAPIAVLGAGTGLGEAVVIPIGQRKHRVFPTEGGHTDFAPRNDREYALLNHLKSVRQLERVSVERVVSGMGIVDIYACLRDRLMVPESADITAQLNSPNADAAAIISKAALDGRDRLCGETLDLFMSAYGAEAGNLALKLLPYGGLFIAGGIAAKLLPLIEAGEFMAAYHAKGRVSGVLDPVRISVVLNPQVGLLGAGICAAQLEP
ncbi:glucokinase [Spirulina major]|uniref:glucokinase n=1 Tax=Spirulina major TaxID=270636 RepID=UPI000934B4FE|nr:glucokinase [Spirulina major]